MIKNRRLKKVRGIGRICRLLNTYEYKLMDLPYYFELKAEYNDLTERMWRIEELYDRPNEYPLLDPSVRSQDYNVMFDRRENIFNEFMEYEKFISSLIRNLGKEVLSGRIKIISIPFNPNTTTFPGNIVYDRKFIFIDLKLKEYFTYEFNETTKLLTKLKLEKNVLFRIFRKRCRIPSKMLCKN